MGTYLLNLKKSHALLFGLLAIAVALGAGKVLAAVPGSDGAVSTCYSNVSGDLKVVESTSQCNSTLEKPLTLAAQTTQKPLQVAYVNIPNYGVVDTAGSKGILNFVYKEENSAYCLDLEFVPHFAGPNNSASGYDVYAAGVPYELATISAICGEGYDALIRGEPVIKAIFYE